VGSWTSLVACIRSNTERSQRTSMLVGCFRGGKERNGCEGGEALIQFEVQCLMLCIPKPRRLSSRVRHSPSD